MKKGHSNETALLIAELRQMRHELDRSMRECTALVCSISIASGIEGLDTPEKVVRACALVHKEIMQQLREEMRK